jgi:hypothetical protein
MNDRDRADVVSGPHRRCNATCPQCGEDYWRGRDDTGWLCDRCCAARDFELTADTRTATPTPVLSHPKAS